MTSRSEYVSLDHTCYRGSYFRTIVAGALTTLGLGAYTGWMIYNKEDIKKICPLALATLTALWATLEGVAGVIKTRHQYVPIQTSMPLKTSDISLNALQEVKTALDKILQNEPITTLPEIPLEDNAQHNLWALIDVQLGHIRDKLNRSTNRETTIAALTDFHGILKGMNDQYSQTLISPIAQITVPSFQIVPEKKYDSETLKTLWRHIDREMVRNQQIHEAFKFQVNTKLDEFITTLQSACGSTPSSKREKIPSTKMLLEQCQAQVKHAEKLIKGGFVEEKL